MIDNVIARYVMALQIPSSENVLRGTQLLTMQDHAIVMLENATLSPDKGDSNKVRGIFKEDETLGIISRYSGSILYAFVEKDTHYFQEALYIHSIIKKRTGDHITNITEEIIFYLYVQVLKHRKENTKN